MASFKSIVALDIETTGLPSHSRKPKITELSMIGILCDHISSDGSLPRIVQKLNACFYPNKMIHYEATEITGLDNPLLEEFPPWNNDANILVSSFFRRLPSPVCVVAHNGMKFDFRVLKSEILAYDQTLPSDIIWADSWLAFRDVFSSRSVDRIDGIIPLETMQQPSPIKPIIPLPILVSDSSENHIIQDQPVNKFQIENESTPKRETVIFNALPVKRKANDESSCNGTLKPVKARKQLFSCDHQPKSFKLVDIYKHIFDEYPPVSHSAECDAMSLLKCIIYTSPKVLLYFDSNHISFSEILPMW